MGKKLSLEAMGKKLSLEAKGTGGRIEFGVVFGRGRVVFFVF